MRYKLGLASIVLASVLGGCTSSNFHSGNNVTSQKVEQIQKGKTTVAELIGWFGTPYSKSVQGDGAETLVFTSSDMSSSTGGPLAFMGMPTETSTNTKQKMLTVTAKNGVVDNYTFSEQ